MLFFPDILLLASFANQTMEKTDEGEIDSAWRVVK
jgi:hypothetical protein